jgi:hypothetical protein
MGQGMPSPSSFSGTSANERPERAMSRWDALVFEARTASPEAIAATIRTRGCVQIKRAIDTAVLRDLYRTIQTPRFERALGIDMIALENLDDRLKFPLIRALHRSPITRIVRALFGSPSLLITCLHGYFRRVSFQQISSALPFHQDAIGFPPDLPEVTASILVGPDRTGGDVPGLQFIPGARDHLLPREKEIPDAAGNYEFLEIKRSLSAELLTQGSWEPALELGDAMVFDKFCVHRSHVGADMRQIRTSIDIRIVPFELQLYESGNVTHRWFVDHPRFLYGPTRVHPAEGKHPKDCPWDHGLLAGGLGGRISYYWAARAGAAPALSRTPLR